MQRKLDMTTKIENITDRKVVVRLSSGETLHIAPRTTSDELNDVEVQNAKIEKLLQRRMIALHQTRGKGSSSRSSR
jgi:hypothetical protein